VRLKQAEAGKEKAKILANKSYNMINHFAHLLMKHAILYMDADQMLREHWNITEETGRDTSARDQQQ
jgi:hypothetical protein